MENLQNYIDKLNKLNFKEMYEGDFFLTWEKTDDELEAVFTIADALRYMREHNISTKIFESGLGISLFRDNSTRTRFSFASACNLLGLEEQVLDEKKSQIAHGETVRDHRLQQGGLARSVLPHKEGHVGGDLQGMLPVPQRPHRRQGGQIAARRDRLPQIDAVEIAMGHGLTPL